LDIILCSDPLLIVNVDVGAPVSTSDHCTTEFLLNVSVSTSNEDGKRKASVASFYNWSKADWNSLKSFLGRTDWWTHLNNSVNADDYYNDFCTILQSA